jgi:Glyoxalase-like domain
MTSNPAPGPEPDPAAPIARYHALCIDEDDQARGEQFWSQVLGLQVTTKDDHSWLAGDRPEQTVWVNAVPEPKTVKNRIHLDVLAGSLGDLYALGARHVADFERWTVLRAPDGQEFCAFLRSEVPDYRMKDLVVDSRDPERIARWWHRVLGGVLGKDPNNPWWWVDEIPGAPFESIDFVEVPEPKTTKNRVHFDVRAPAVSDLVDAGATLLRPKGADLGWHILADPDGNEFCVFDAPD